MEFIEGMKQKLEELNKAVKNNERVLNELKKERDRIQQAIDLVENRKRKPRQKQPNENI